MTFFNENQIRELTTLKLYSKKYIPYYSCVYQAGFSSEQIIKIAKQGSVEAVISLSNLCQKKDKFENFQRKNIGHEHFVRIISHRGGSKNLHAFEALLGPLVDTPKACPDADERYFTPLHQLTQAGFSTADLIGVVSHDGGSKNLNALCALLEPVVDASGTSEVLIPLHQLMQFGFSAADIIGVVNYSGGSKNLQAFCDLLGIVVDASRSSKVLIPLHQLTQAGFSAADLMGVVSNYGGSKNLQALCKLFVPVIVTSGSSEVLIPLHQLMQVGFSAADIIRVVSQGGGSKNLKALRDLLKPVVNAHGLWQYAGEVPVTPLHQFMQAGFSRADLIGVLNHGGGSKNLQALCDLLAPVIDASGGEVFFTRLYQLTQAGFSAADLIGVLSHDGGSKNLQALWDLLVPVDDASGSPEVIIPLHELIQAGFSAADLIAVVSHGGGSKNLYALRDLLVPVVDASWSSEVLIPLNELMQAEFSAADLIAVVSHGGGSKNLKALCTLLKPVRDVFEVPQYEGEIPLTSLYQLTQAGFSRVDLIGVLNHSGGSINLEALCDLLEPVVDGSGTWQYAPGEVLLTPLYQLTQAGFSAADLIGVISHKGGSKNLQALRALLKPVVDTSSTGEVLTNRLNQLTQAGFSASQLIGVLNHDGGSKNLDALCDLLEPVVVTSGSSEVMIPLHQLMQAGFSAADLSGVVNHHGGSKNLQALRTLLKPVVDDLGTWQYAPGKILLTPLYQLTQAGFNAADLIGVVSHIGGSKNLEALCALLEPVVDDLGTWQYAPGEVLLTPLYQLTQAGFSAADLIGVISHNGGSKNLQALRDLLKPVVDDSGTWQYEPGEVLLTPLYQLKTQAGFYAAELIKVLRHDGGSKNLQALCDLLVPVVDASCSEVLIPLHQLMQAGFSAADLIGVVSQSGGSKNLQALYNLLNNERSFFSTYSNASEPIAILAKGASKSAHIELLNAILKYPDIQQTIKTNSLLEPLCKKIKPLSAKKIKELSINCPEELLAFLNLSTAENVARMGKKRPAEQSVEALQKSIVNEAGENPKSTHSQNQSSFFHKKRRLTDTPRAALSSVPDEKRI